MDGKHANEHSHALIGKFLAGECSPQEEAEALAWIQASPENGATYAAMRRVWEASSAETPALDAEIDVDAAWRKVQARMTRTVELPLQPPAPGRRTQGRLWFAVAAVLVVAIGAYLVWLAQQQGPAAPQQLSWASGDAPLHDTLPDGSIVTLNAHSRLEFPATFADAATRAVKLEGEAFFDVHRDPSQPFVITAGGTEVRVLGTAFNVRATAPEVVVSVREGKVRFAASPETGAAAVELSAGKSATYRAATKALVADSLPDANADFWLTGRLVFEDRPLDQVVAELGKRWQQPIRLADPAIGACRLTATFERPSIESTLQRIAETFNLQVAHDENTFTLSGEGCK